jgi:hypothetical protein
LTGQLFAAGAAGRHEIWRYLVLGSLAGLCVEVWLTRRMARNSGIADAPSVDAVDAERSGAR